MMVAEEMAEGEVMGREEVAEEVAEEEVMVEEEGGAEEVCLQQLIISSARFSG